MKINVLIMLTFTMGKEVSVNGIPSRYFFETSEYLGIVVLDRY